MAKRSTDTGGKQRTSAAFSDEDVTLIGEALRIASHDIRQTVETLTRVWPSSPLVERLTIAAERMTDLHEAINA